MAAPSGLITEPAAPSQQQQTQEVFPWLKNLPLAPEYHPTLAEFQDPIAYIFKIEKEASKYGICKIVPPVLASPKRAAIANLNRSLAARSSSSSNPSPPTFTTRQQQIGFCPRKPRPVQKPVWQSGENYTFQEFEAKAKSFEKSYFRKCSSKRTTAAFSPLEIETLYWKATVDKPFSVEYANDMPGSAFSDKKMNGGKEMNEGVTVGETEWNMRGVSRAKGSLLRFMKEEIPGVTSPMVYVAMMFSWFAWHVEDHDLHSLNYLHMGAGKTWYGVPREAAVAFEDVVRDHGYGGELNPLVTFSVLGEKTTVMSPEVFIAAGVPCCRLVQNAGEFVVTFPRAYHSGFSHGFNCGEAANIATPEWLTVAKDAAIRRASINYPPMVSHFQLLYDLALELCTRMPMSISAKPRSSRLKDKQKSEGETLVKEQFVSNVIRNNRLLHILGKGTAVVLLPRSSSDISVCSNLRVGSQLRVNPSPGLCSNEQIIKSSKTSVSDDTISGRNHGINQAKDILSVKQKFASLCERNRFASSNGNDDKHAMHINTKTNAAQGDKLSDQRLFSCVTCGILSFDCVAVVQPTETAARYLMSADCSFLNDWIVGSGISNDKLTTAGVANTSDQDQPTGWTENSDVDGLYDVPVQSINYQLQKINQNKETSDNKTRRQFSALGLLALNYGNSSDSEEDKDEPNVSDRSDEIAASPSESKYKYHSSALPSLKQECHNDETISYSDYHGEHGHGHGPSSFKDGSDRILNCSAEFESNLANTEPNGLDQTFRDTKSMSRINSHCSPIVHDTEKAKFSRVVPGGNQDTTFTHGSDEDSSRLHVFCLEHAVEVEQQFRSIGGVHILLLCHPEYPRLEAEAKIVSEELGIDYLWNDIAFRDATKNDEENIQSALDSEEAIPGNGDWAVKLGINLFYSANLSRSPLYSKQMPYNSVIYKAFGRMSPASSPTKLNIYGKRSSKQRKTVAGRWCGKVWMSNQVHPFLLKCDSEDRDQEQEQQENVSGWKWPEERNERKLQSLQKTETTLAATKSGKKRKTATSSRPAKKFQSQETENAGSDDLEEDVSHKQHTKVYSRRRTKHIQREDSYDSLDDSRQQQWRSHGIKQAKSVDRDDAVSDDLLVGNTLQQHRRILKSKQVKSIASERQLGRIPRTKSKRVKYVQRTVETSDDSLEGDMHKWGRGFHRSAQAKFYEREEEVSDDSLEESSHKSLKIVRRCKQPLYFENEDAISDDSVENYSPQQNRSTSRGSRPKYFQRENEVSDDMLEVSTYRKGAESGRNRKNKFFDRESENSDDSLADDTEHQHMKTFSMKQDRFAVRGDEISDDSLEGDFQRHQRRFPASKRAKFAESEDAVSEDMEDGSHLAHWGISRSKKAKNMGKENFSDDLQDDDDAQCQRRKTTRGKPAKFIERKVASENLEGTSRLRGKITRHKRVISFEREGVSDDLQEEDMLWQPRKTARGKQAKFLEKEDVSDDMEEDDDTHWQKSKIPRGKQAKFVDPEDANSDDLLERNSTEQHRKRSKQKLGTLSEMKQDTLRHVKQRTSLAKKRETPKSVKQEKEKKLENFRLRNGKNEHGGRLFELHDEEDVEGGPSTRLRKRASRPSRGSEAKIKEKLQSNKKKVKGASAVKLLAGKKNSKNKEEDAEFQCDVEGCTMSFGSKQELALHKRNICPVKGCGKTFFSHKYLVQHRRVHLDERPLKCPWKGCKMTFKWAWARTEHIRVHTGARPYVCAEEGCGQTFRFVSDFSRHKRKTGHSVKKSRK